jgi:hypothetical protein
MSKIAIFYHIFREDVFSAVQISEQMEALRQSGLYDKASHIFLSAVGRGQSIQWLKRDYPKCDISETTENKFELTTLEKLLSFASHNPDTEILYMHTKGITKLKNPAVRDWRELMEYYCLYKHELCLELLKDHSVVGVNLLPTPMPHFSGNFWWTKASHINTLPCLLDGKLSTLDLRMSAEFWVCSTEKSSLVSVHQSMVNHYTTRYPEDNYKTLDDKESISRAYQDISTNFTRNGAVPPNPPKYA